MREMNGDMMNLLNVIIYIYTVMEFSFVFQVVQSPNLVGCFFVLWGLPVPMSGVLAGGTGVGAATGVVVALAVGLGAVRGVLRIGITTGVVEVTGVLGVLRTGITTGVAGVTGCLGGKITLGVLVILASEDNSLLLWADELPLGDGRVCTGVSGFIFVKSGWVCTALICLNRLGTSRFVLFLVRGGELGLVTGGVKPLAPGDPKFGEIAVGEVMLVFRKESTILSISVSERLLPWFGFSNNLAMILSVSLFAVCWA